MSAGAALLAVLEAARSADTAAFAPGGLQNRKTRGLAAAVSLDQLLSRNRLSWGDVIAQGSLLAKLCGRLGSAYEAEQEAAYGHALRFIYSRRSTWPGQLRLPKVLVAAMPAAEAPQVPQIADHAVPPPENDWITTVQRLKARAAWRSDEEHERLDGLELDLAHGQAMHVEDAKWLRNIWWCAELNDPGPEEAHG